MSKTTEFPPQIPKQNKGQKIGAGCILLALGVVIVAGVLTIIGWVLQLEAVNSVLCGGA